eukprot:m.267315 g.267315  ORF g.267315 m.267315 type:complete len:524 (+) comp32902_c0_seq1:1-1572(+)
MVVPMWKLLTFLAFLGVCSALRIVSLGLNCGLSHSFQQIRIGKAAVKRGHEFVFVVGTGDLATGKLDVEGFTVVEYATMYDDFKLRKARTAELQDKPPLDGLKMLTEDFVLSCKALLYNKTAMDILKSQKVDVLLADGVIACTGILHEILKPTAFVAYSPVGFYDPWLSEPQNVPVLEVVSYVPQMGSRLLPTGDFKFRLTNMITFLINKLLMNGVTEPAYDAIRAELGIPGNNHKSWSEYTSVYVLQSSWVLEFARPVPPTVQLVGPITPSIPINDLPEDLDQFLKSAGDNGVVLVSLGTAANPSQQQVEIMAKAFARLPSKVLWKVGDVVPSSVTSNIKTVSWFPQNDLLGRPEVRAFFTHGGWNTVQECAFHGVPMVGLPLFGDQWDNLVKAEYHGLAVSLAKDNLTEEAVLHALTTVLTTESFATRGKAIAKVMQAEYNTRAPVERTVDWIEYAEKFDGATFLRPGSYQLSTVQRANLDILALFALFVWFLFAILKCCVCRCCCRRKTTARAGEIKKRQ